MISKIIKISAILPLVYLMVVPAWYSSPAKTAVITKIDLVIIDSADYHFVTRRNIESIINQAAGRIIGKSPAEVSLSDIESEIRKLQELKSVEVFFSIDGTLHVDVDQRDPILRIIPMEGGDFFMDEEGVIFRKRNLYSPRLHVAHGYIDISPEMLRGVSVQDTSVKSDMMRDIYDFTLFLNSDRYWSAQIDQIYVGRGGEISLIPRMGNHIVKLGTFEDYRDKLDNLNALYHDVLPDAGWDRYSLINLEFSGQVVCKRRN